MITKIFWAMIFSLFVIHSVAGEKLGPVMRLGPGFSPEVAYNSETKDFFVIWPGSVPYYGRLRGTFIALDGTRTPVRTYSIPLRQSSPSDANILFDPGSDRFLLIWQENNKNVFTRFIDAAGRASPINKIYNNDIGFGAFGINSARQPLTGEYLVNASSARRFILDQNGSILHKFGTIQLTSMKIFSTLKDSGYSVFGSNGGNLVFQTLDSQGRPVGDRTTILQNGTWHPLVFSTLPATFNPQNNQYLLLYLSRQKPTINGIRVTASGKPLGPSHELDTSLVAQPQVVTRNGGYRAFFTGVVLGLYSRKLDLQGLPDGSELVIHGSQNGSDLASKIAVASTLDRKRHLICWQSELYNNVSCRFLYE